VEDKPWWVYACQIIIVACGIFLLTMMTANVWRSTEPGSGLDLTILVVGFALMAIIVVGWAGKKDGPLWRFVRFWFWGWW
jgi:hypothetical protein